MFTPQPSTCSALLQPVSPFVAHGVQSQQQCLLLLETLFDKLLSCYQAHNTQRFAEFGFHLGRCTAIIDHLHERLDLAGSQGLAQHFATIYRHADWQLQQAALNQDAEPLAEAQRVLQIAYECARNLADLAQGEPAYAYQLQ